MCWFAKYSCTAIRSESCSELACIGSWQLHAVYQVLISLFNSTPHVFHISSLLSCKTHNL
jgi:hypothetical protein